MPDIFHVESVARNDFIKVEIWYKGVFGAGADAGAGAGSGAGASAGSGASAASSASPSDS